MKGGQKFTPTEQRSFSKNAFSVLLLSGLTYQNIEYLAMADPFLRCICMLHYMAKRYRNNFHTHVFHNESQTVEVQYKSMLDSKVNLNIVNLNETILPSFSSNRLVSKSPGDTENSKTEDIIMKNTEESKFDTMMTKLGLEELAPLVSPSLMYSKIHLVKNHKMYEFFKEKVISCPIDLF